jgi:hypothetical protein
MQASLPSFIQGSAAQHRLHLTAFGAVRGGHLAEKVILYSFVLFKSAAGDPTR